MFIGLGGPKRTLSKQARAARASPDGRVSNPRDRPPAGAVGCGLLGEPHGARSTIASRGSFVRGTPIPSHSLMHGTYVGRKPSSCGIVTIR